MDMEKAIKQIEKCVNDTSCVDCPYEELLICRDYMLADALSMLKEQEERIKQLELEKRMGRKS